MRSTAVLLDIDDTLRITTTDTDGNRIRLLNEMLVSELVSQGLTDVYLFSNMGLEDIESICEQPSRLSRKQLINTLRAKGLTVHCVITPPDPVYAKGIGAAFDHIYMSGYNKKLRDSLYKNETTQFNTLAGQLIPEQELAELTPDNKAARQKRRMFEYFMKNKPAEITSLMYFEDNQACINEVSNAAADLNTRITACKVDPKILLNSPELEKQKYIQSITNHLCSNPIIANIDPESDKKKMLGGLLSEYILAIDSLPDKTQGFCLFKNSQKNNRLANRDLADKLLVKLSDPKSKIADVFSKQSLTENRSNPNLIRSIHSNQLNDIIKQARHLNVIVPIRRNR